MTPSVPAAIKSSFPAVADGRTRILVLGSLPGEVSLARAEYYAHPRNQFWRLIQAVTGVELADVAYLTRLDALRAAGVGLWDVIRSAERAGSLDARIRNHRPNSLGDLVESLPSLKAIAFNGAKASQIGRKQLGVASGIAFITLPSSSPAHAAMSFEQKLVQWLRLRAFLAL